jgi:hypothetical protein
MVYSVTTKSFGSFLVLKYILTVQKEDLVHSILEYTANDRNKTYDGSMSQISQSVATSWRRK